MLLAVYKVENTWKCPHTITVLDKCQAQPTPQMTANPFSPPPPTLEKFILNIIGTQYYPNYTIVPSNSLLSLPHLELSFSQLSPILFIIVLNIRMLTTQSSDVLKVLRRIFFNIEPYIDKKSINSKALFCLSQI